MENQFWKSEEQLRGWLVHEGLGRHRSRCLDHPVDLHVVAEAVARDVWERIGKLVDAVYLEPCHITGEHDPKHTHLYVCNFQRAEILKRILDVLGMPKEEIPRRMHEGCAFCATNLTPGASWPKDSPSVQILQKWAEGDDADPG